MPQNEFKKKIVNWLPDSQPTTLYVRSFQDAVFTLLSNTDIAKEGNFVFPDKQTPFGLGPLAKKTLRNYQKYTMVDDSKKLTTN